MADMIILMPGFCFLQIATKLPKSEMMASNVALLSISFVPTWKITISKSVSTAFGGLSCFDKSLLLNRAIVSPGNDCTTHPRIPETFLAIESQIIVTFLTCLDSENINKLNSTNNQIFQIYLYIQSTHGQ